MLKEFKYLAVSKNGKVVQGIVVSQSRTKAKTMIGELAIKYQLKINNILPKRTYLYYVTLPNGKKVKGRQAAFSKQEVALALENIGYRNAKIEPVVLDIRFKPPFASIMMFVNLASFLLREKMSFDKILRMLAEDEPNATLRETLKKIESELKKGKEGTEVFNRYADVFGRFPAYMLGLATKSGNMAEVYEATAKFMERDMEYRKSLNKALLVPTFTVVLMIGAVLYYVIVIFPATAKLFLKFNIPIPPLTAGTLKMSDFLAAHWWWIILMMLIPTIILLLWWRTPNGMVWRDKNMIKLPIIGHLLHKSSIEIFFRVFSAIYAGAENNIETIQASAEACRNAYIEKGIRTITIPLMLKDGLPLVPALQQAKVFNRTTLNRLKTGTESGNVLQSAKQIATFYEKETTYKMNTIIESIQVFIGMFIGIVITLLTIVSSEIATVSPPAVY
ncbi:MAG: type II secretion system F family protein [Candidatus Cloacimonetes bacterium]|nr:type II secretion system F family protein [Candidatus Cloacimonadota bacterium]